MNYELALELKKAGFPYRRADLNEGLHTEILIFEDWNGAFYTPTLSELVEACGDGFKMLIKMSNDGKEPWEAGKWIWQDGYSWTSDENSPQGAGSTPEEAVAKLWLELNKKK